MSNLANLAKSRHHSTTNLARQPTWQDSQPGETANLAKLPTWQPGKSVNLATMSVLIDKSACPHASGQQTAMHVCNERGREARAGGRAAGGLA